MPRVWVLFNFLGALQTRLAFTIVERALGQVGASLEDVVRTRLFVRHLQRDGEAVSRAHGEVRLPEGSRDLRPLRLCPRGPPCRRRIG